MVLDHPILVVHNRYPGDSRSRPIRWLQSFVWRSTRGWTLGPGSCSSCGLPALGPGTAWHSLETLSISDRGRQSPSETRCRCSIPTLWIPQSRTEALHEEQQGGREKMLNKMEEQDVLDERRRIWVKEDNVNKGEWNGWSWGEVEGKRSETALIQATLSPCLYFICA